LERFDASQLSFIKVNEMRHRGTPKIMCIKFYMSAAVKSIKKQKVLPQMQRFSYNKFMETVKIKKISEGWHVFCPECQKWISLSLFKKQDKTLVCVFCGFVINKDEQKWQFL
jgi:hypothetical protein